MAAAKYRLVIEQGATFGRTLLFGEGAIFNITSFADAGGGKVTANAAGHTMTDGDYVKIVAFDEDNSISYTGSFLVSGTVAAVSFEFVNTWQGTTTGTVQKSRDLTGKGFRAQGRETYADTAALVEFTCSIVSAVGGQVTLGIGADVTAGYTPIEHAVWTGELYDLVDTTDVERSLQGKMVITAEGAK